MKKKIAFISMLVGLSVISITPAFAGQWKQDSKGWWWQEDNGSYPVSAWKEINGRQYYFGADGYMLANTTTPDGYTVNADGAWEEKATIEINSPKSIVKAGNKILFVDTYEFAKNGYTYQLLTKLLC